MLFLADLHIHSRFSRATSRQLTVPHLAAWARCKGIKVLGTGDFTHPRWRAELAEHLRRDEASDLYTLAGQPEHLEFLDNFVPAEADDAPLFCLQAEISSIYKRHGKVRKVHNLVFVPTIEDAERFSAKLARIGNLDSDGRPILGLDSHDLLEILLETSPNGALIPAHIWTPWFSLFGSKSGFDEIVECFADLSDHIFALETGLSSNPAMNRHVSQLDSYALVSNSDAHSGANLGREANIFEGFPSYAGIFKSLARSAKREPQDDLDCRFLGTLEFYPEEGKYHLDGHRLCRVSFEPQEALARNNICPVCGKPLTIGVLHRVMELADRNEPCNLPLEPRAHTLFPLVEVLGEILGAGPSSRKVQARYSTLLRALGSELAILYQLPVADIRQHWEPLGEAVARLREGRVILRPGFDGQFGTVRVFSPDELAEIRGGRRLPGLNARHRAGMDPPPSQLSPQTLAALPLFKSAMPQPRLFASERLRQLDFTPAQISAIKAGPGPVLVLAGPGSGKTRVLIGRIALLLEQGVNPDRLLALTFTRRAAAEMRERLAQAPLCPPKLPRCDTLHALAWGLLREYSPHVRLLSDDAAMRLFFQANPELTQTEGRRVWNHLELAREQRRLSDLEFSLASAAERYAAHKTASADVAYVDYTDLLEWLLEADIPLLPAHLLVDEVQDLTPLQLAIIRKLLPADGAGFFGIGDPDQAIYSFRGASGHSDAAFHSIWPDITVLRLGESFRSSQAVLDMAQHLLDGQAHCGRLTSQRELPAQLRLFSARNDADEARWVARNIAKLLGGSAHTLMDQAAARQVSGALDGTLSPGDIAVLVRIKAQLPLLVKFLEEAGIPFTVPGQQSFWQDEHCAALLSLLAPHYGLTLQPEKDAGEEGQKFCSTLPWAPELLPHPSEMGKWIAAQPCLGASFIASHAYAELCQFWQECGSWPIFFERLIWIKESERARAHAEHVQLLTLHASKGLEFNAVFLPGVEDGLLPLRWESLFPAGNHVVDVTTLPEERRLLYVGLTRAKQGIFVSHSAGRMLYGRKLNLAPSPFLPLIRSFCLESRSVVQKRTSLEQGSLLPQADRNGRIS